MLQGIEQAKDRAVMENHNLKIMIIKLPSLLIHSSNLNADLLNPYLQNLPVKLPESIWTYRKFILIICIIIAVIPLIQLISILLLFFQEYKAFHGH